MKGRIGLVTSAAIIVVLSARGATATSLSPAVASTALGQMSPCPAAAPMVVVDGGPGAPGSPGVERRFATGYFNYPLSSGPDAVDLDGDGFSDTVRINPDGSVTVRADDGDRTYAVAGRRLWAAGIGKNPIEGFANRIVVFEVGGGQALPIGRAWVMPVGQAPGTYDPRASGVDTGMGLPFTGADRDGDGVGDLLTVVFEDPADSQNGTTRVVSGRAVDEAAPGSVLPASATIATIEGILDQFARVDGQTPLEGIDAVYQRDGRVITRSRSAEAVTLRVFDGQLVQAYTTEPEALVDPESAFGSAVTFAWVADDGPYLSFTQMSQAGSRTYWWKLVTCTPEETTTSVTAPPVVSPPSTPTTPSTRPTPTAPGAAAIVGSATFTG